MLKAFEDANGKPVPFEFAPRRAGDVASYDADVSLVNTMLGWRTSRTIDDMCRDTWRWQQSNPEGYRKKSLAIDAKAAQHGLKNNLTNGNETI